AMAELHEHLRGAETYCPYCCIHTGDREEFYAHFTSFNHVQQANDHIKELPHSLELLTILVNIHRKEVISAKQFDEQFAIEKYSISAPTDSLMKGNDKILEEKWNIDKPDSISDEIWQNFYELGISTTNLVLHAIHVYGTGRFVCWDKNRVKEMEESLGKVKEEMR
ncbi:hypothetical protein PMAYCL1PPCAC_25006, partial [Pristionchus mayeri]